MSSLDVRPASERDVAPLNALYVALFDSLVGEDVHRAYAGITQPNEASEALHRRFGFEPIGTFEEVGRKEGRYWSVGWWQKRL